MWDAFEHPVSLPLAADRMGWTNLNAPCSTETESCDAHAMNSVHLRHPDDTHRRLSFQWKQSRNNVITIDDIVNEESNGHNEEDLTFPDETFADCDALRQCLQPIKLLLMIFGAYFDRDNVVADTGDKPPTATSSGRRQRIYCVAILVLMSLNAARSVFLFTSDDIFGSQLMIKVVLFLLLLLCAILQTPYFVANESGRLNRIIRETRVTPECVAYFRKFAHSSENIRD